MWVGLVTVSELSPERLDLTADCLVREFQIQRISVYHAGPGVLLGQTENPEATQCMWRYVAPTITLRY